MLDNLTTISVNEIKNGYVFNKETNKYVCNICGKEYERGEIFKIEERYFDAEKMIRIHIEEEHSEVLINLMSYDKKLTGLTDNQKELLIMISSGKSDNEIAKKMNVSPATIRHQRFTFREKAKQAKIYLAIYELAFNNLEKNKQNPKEDLLNIHEGAKMIDDRYFTTKAEEDKALNSMFSSLEPLKLITFPSKEKKKIVILKKISEKFKHDKKYTEKEINSILKDIYEDFATIRRYLIEYGFMERTIDCKYYWLKE